jgi:hypothetical protein
VRILTIRAHKRYAVRQPVCLRAPDRHEVTGLLIELSVRGCRISNLDCAELSDGDQITLILQDATLSGRVKWTRGSLAGFNFDDPLLLSELRDLIAGGPDDGVVVRSGT